MQNKLLILVAALSALVALTEAAASTVTCVPVAKDKTFVVGQTTTCTCKGSGAALDPNTWSFGGEAKTGTGDKQSTYVFPAFTAADNAKALSCVGTTGDTGGGVTMNVEELAKPEIKCDPAKVEKDKESTCTCTNKNKATATKYTFSVDAGTAKDGDQGDKKDGIKVKITKEAKVTCMVYFSDTIKTAASAEAKIELSGGSDSGSASLHSALSLVVMMFASIIVSIL